MSLSEKSFDFLKKSAHRLPRKLFIVANEVFEITRGVMLSITPSARHIRKIQESFLKNNFKQDIRSLIVFLTPGLDIVNGGILSVTSLFEETKKLKFVHGSESVLCTYPSDPPLLKYTKFKNSSVLLSFSAVLNYFNKLESLIIHIPEHFIYRFYWCMPNKNKLAFKKIRHVQINVMIQNLAYLPSTESVRKLRAFGELTSTTAHSKYSTLELRNNLGFPLHKLSVFVSPEQYYQKKYVEKDNLMVVSPDRHPRKGEILKIIKRELPELEIKIIEKMTYEEYKEIISKAKWALTFGEGLDGYFIEPVFSGGVSFSVYNPSFFTNDFKYLLTVYDSYDAMRKKIVKDLKSLDNEPEYLAYSKKEFELCGRYYDYKQYIDNLKAFYECNYTFK